MLARDPLANPEALIPRVYAYVAYRIGEGPDAEDVTSDAFERALRYRASYDHRRGDALSWLIGIARRCVADRMAPAQAGIEQTPELSVPGDLEEDAVRRLTISAALAGLDEHDRELIALRYGADLTARQIASVLGRRTNSVEVALHRALGRLRQRLEAAEVGATRSDMCAEL